MANTLANYKVFETSDLKSAYHHMGFEAIKRLYHFCRISFGVTNSVAVFQRAMDKMVDEDGLNNTFPYLDNMTFAGKDQEEHDTNVQGFLQGV